MAATTANKPDRKRTRQPKQTIGEAMRYALGHKTRVEILIALNEKPFTSQELAERLEVPQGNISNHLQNMLADGSVEIAREERKGNMTQFWYKAVEVPIYSTKDAEAMTPLHRQMTVGAITQAGLAEILAALDAGTLADPKSIVYWDWYNLDAKGQEELDIESHQYMERVREIEVASINRMAKSREEGTSILMNLDVFQRARKVESHK